jgi:hypothetical protein
MPKTTSPSFNSDAQPSFSGIYEMASSPSALELASRTHRNIFFAYMCWLAVAAIATLLFTWALWKSSNRRQDAAKAEADLRVLNVEQTVADSKKAAAEANKIAEGERLARVKLEARLAPRSLKGESQKAVANAIRAFAPQSFDILWYADDPESHDLANDIYAAFQHAGWVLDSSNSWLGFSVILGVVIEFAPSATDTVGTAGDALAAALQEEGIDAKAQSRVDDEKEKQPERLRIKVGKKP